VTLLIDSPGGRIDHSARMADALRRLPMQRELNPAVYGPGATTANINQRLYPLPLMTFQLNQNIGSTSDNPCFFTIVRQQF